MLYYLFIISVMYLYIISVMLYLFCNALKPDSRVQKEHTSLFKIKGVLPKIKLILLEQELCLGMQLLVAN